MLVSCGSKKSNDVLLAKIDKEQLFLSDIDMPKNLSPEDSLEYLKNATQRWIIDQLMYLDAKSNLSEDEMLKIDKQIENSRKLMIISSMEEKLVSDSSKIIVSEEEINKYYNEHSGEFLLKENIVKLLYLKLKKSEPDIAKIRTLVKSDNPSDRTELLAFARNKALNYFIEDNVWLYFNDILKEIPINVDNQSDFLKSTSFYETSNDSIIYLIRFKGHMLTDSPAPLVLVRDNIKSILIVRKKNTLINDYRNKLYENALKDKKVTLYIN
jgi:hypothetical protein